MRLSFIVLVLLALGGCRSVMDPTFMPAGYAYHSDYYKSPPGPEAPGIGYPYSPVANAAVIEQWRIVAAQLVDRLESELGLGPQVIYVDASGRKGAFHAAYDYALREELRSRGYALANDGVDALTLRSGAIEMKEDKSARPQAVTRRDTPDVPRDFLLTVSVLRNGVPLGAVEDQFSLPAYGYVESGEEDKKEPALAPPAAAQAPQDILDAPGNVSGEPL